MTDRNHYRMREDSNTKAVEATVMLPVYTDQMKKLQKEAP